MTPLIFNIVFVPFFFVAGIEANESIVAGKFTRIAQGDIYHLCL